MAFDITINREDIVKFTDILRLYPEYNYATVNTNGCRYKFTILGEDMEKDTQLQETLMEHLDEVEIEETIG